MVKDALFGIGESIIHDYNLYISIRLAENTSDCISQVTAIVIIADNDAYTWIS
jgi:hypothetical protein